ncbi:M16 family metallopeptidase [Nakamurella lactea]|uniref:M16 family metallopeptidase n=1 Tax=Nakamurella lactea TaxID=459515 RepID=UPI000688A3E8|nr:pitrilysin family protein [Nakamurella lactea]
MARTAAGRRRTVARTAEQIARTDIGPRPVPPLMKVRASRVPAAESAVLDNGLRVVAVRRPGAPLVEVRLRIPFGGRTELRAARAEVLAASAMLGTADRDRFQVDMALADLGAHLDTAVDPQRLLYSGSVLSNGLPDLLGLLTELLTSPAYRRRDVLGERDRLVEYLRLAKAQPGVVARMALQHRRFGDHPAAWEMPDAELVNTVGPAAVGGLHRRSVVPDGATLVLVGDLQPGKAVGLAAATLAGWAADHPATTLATPPPITGGPVQLVHRNGSVQSQVRLTAPAVGRGSPDYAALQIANLVFGGYFSSRLVENIREDKGYTYSAHSAIEFWPGTAAMTVSFDCATDATAAALLETRYELGRIALTAPGAAEVESARNYALGSLAISLATQAGYASTVSAIHGAGQDLQWLRDHPARLAAVTADEVAAVSAKYLAPSAFTGVVVGDRGAVEASLQRLGDVDPG